MNIIKTTLYYMMWTFLVAVLNLAGFASSQAADKNIAIKFKQDVQVERHVLCINTVTARDLCFEAYIKKEDYSKIKETGGRID